MLEAVHWHAHVQVWASPLHAPVTYFHFPIVSAGEGPSSQDPTTQGLHCPVPAPAHIPVLPPSIRRYRAKRSAGLGLHWPVLDADIYVPALLAGVFGSRSWMASVLGAKGGKASTPEKAAAARANGRKGGRPSRAPPEPAHPSSAPPGALLRLTACSGSARRRRLSAPLACPFHSECRKNGIPVGPAAPADGTS